MSSFVPDTCALIDLPLLDLGAHANSTPVVTAITVGELAFGLDVSDARQREIRTARLGSVLANFEVLPYGVEEAKLYGVLATLIRAAGRNPRPRRLDLQIAATAA